MIKIRIGWITDKTLESQQRGGTEVTNQYMIEYGKQKGYDITIITPENIKEIIFSYIEFDLLIINNTNNFNIYLDNLLAKKIPYITYNHDFNFCLFRNADCKRYNCERCDEENNVVFDWYKNLFKNAKLNIFLSPMHYEMTKAKIPDLAKSSIIPAPINLDEFKNLKSKRDKDYVYVGNIYGGKGIKDLCKNMKGENVDIYGQLWEPNLKKLIDTSGFNYKGNLPYGDIPKTLNKYKYFLRYSNLKESFGRSTVEALACGCKVIKSGSIMGVDSFEWSDEELLKKCHNAPKDFWTNIEKVTGNYKMKLLVLLGSGLGNIIQTTSLINGLKLLGHDIDVALWSSMPEAEQCLENWDSVDNVFTNNEITGNYDLVIETVHAKAHQFKGVDKWEILKTNFSGWVDRKNDIHRNLEVLNDFTTKNIFTLPPAYCSYNKKYVVPKKKYIVLANGSNNDPKWIGKKWPYYETLVTLMDKYTFIVVGKEGEGLTKKYKNVIDMTGKLSLRDTLAIIKGAKLFIGNDSGLTHCAGALGVKTIVIFGFTDPIKCLPYGDVSMIRNEIPCSPCQYNSKLLNKCKKHRCIEDISPLTVRDTALKVLENKVEKPMTPIERITRNNKFAKEFFSRTEFKKNDVIKICWLQQLQKLGGAELSNLTVIQNASKDFEIVPVTQYSFNKKILENCDIVIVNNIWRFSTEQTEYLKGFFKTNKKLVNYEHDHEAILSKDWSFITEDNWKSNIMKDVFTHSILDVFISPFHYENFKKYFNIGRPLCLPLAVDTKFFKDLNMKRRNVTISLISGGVIPKDTLDYIKEHSEEKFEIYSQFETKNVPLPENVVLKDAVDYFKLPELLSSVKRLLFYPHVIHSGGRVLFEAYLCGCEVIFNDKVGHGSWDIDWDKKDDKIVKWLEDSPKEFWNKIKIKFFEYARMNK